MARRISRQRVRHAIGIGGVVVALAALVSPATASADYNTQVAGLLVAGPNLLLQKQSFSVHKGNERCGDDAADQVPPAAQRAFCYQARGFIGEGFYDTELWFRYAIITPMGSEGVKGILVNDLTKRCLDLSENRVEDRRPIQMWSCNNSTAQDFQTTSSGELRVRDRCVDGGGGDVGSLVTIRSCDGGSDQQWRFDGRGRLVTGKGRCMDVENRSTGEAARMRVADCDNSSAQQWLGSSGYVADGHTKIVKVGTSQLDCAVARVDDTRPARRFFCTTSSVHPLSDSTAPEPHWSVTAAATPPANADRVIFLGDSVTAGFGYCGVEGGDNSDDINCGVNAPMANAWKFGDNNLSACKPPDPVNDRCSNDNNRGKPWESGPWAPDPTAPTVAYPFVVAKTQKTDPQRPADQAYVEDWAVTGSEPVDWDPNGGRFGSQLEKIKNSWVVMTLGANPLLSDYIKVTILGIPFTSGVCASSTVHSRIVQRGYTQYFAAPLDAADHSGKPGLFRCFDNEWNKIQQSEHLLSIYKSLLKRDNHVLVLGYPAGCPWSFGEWQTDANLADGPAKGYACTSLKYPVWDGNGNLSQWDQAKALGGRANDNIQRVAAQAGRESGKPNDIRFALPDQGAWSGHQAWNGDAWIFKNDTWVHPNDRGHEQLARTVTSSMCDAWKHWCGSPPSWK
jgi:Ricin-type beta-trefoil lectin domain